MLARVVACARGPLLGKYPQSYPDALNSENEMVMIGRNGNEHTTNEILHLGKVKGREGYLE